MTWIKQFQLGTIKRLKLRANVVVLSVVLLALAIRVIGLGSESAWMDEAYSITLARYPIMQIIQGTAADQHPPLYYLLLHYWMMISGSIPFTRLLSAVLGTINIIQVLYFGGKLKRVNLGIGTAILLTISPLHIWYSQEARQYMLLAVLTTGATIGLWDCLQGKKRWWLYGIFSALAIYTQYFAVFIFISHAIVVAVWSYRQRSWRFIRPWMVSMLAVAIVFLPWLPTAINQFKHHTMPWIGEPAAGDVRDVILRLVAGSGVLVLPSSIRWLGLAILLVIVCWIIYKYIIHEEANRLGFLFVGLWAFIPFVMISSIAIFYPIFQMKQYLIILVPLFILMTSIALSIPRPWGRVFFACLALMGGFTSVYQQATLSKDDWRGLASYLDTHQKTGDMVYGNPAASLLGLSLYWQAPLPFEGYPPNYDILTGGWAGEPTTSQSADVELTKYTKGYQRVWLVEFFPQFWDPHRYLSTWLSRHSTLIDTKAFGNIQLSLYELSHK